MKKRGRFLLQGSKLDLRQAGGVTTTSITIAVAIAIVKQTDISLLSDNGGPIHITAYSLLYRIKFVRRKGTLI